jgi:Flp pilus assembly protein TadG
MLGRLARGLRASEGATLVETAISALVLFTFLFGILQASLLYFSYNYVSEAAREGARWAIVRGATSCTNTPNLTDCDATSAQIESYIKGLGYAGINSANLSVTTTWKTATTSGSPATTTWSTCSTGTCNAPGDAVHVQVSYPFQLNLPIPITTINVSATSQMVISQ